jgi:hypothetical protein
MWQASQAVRDEAFLGLVFKANDAAGSFWMTEQERQARREVVKTK